MDTASTPVERQVALWVDDFTWHRKMFAQSRWRWFPETAVNIVAHKTGGRLDFASTADVPFLEGAIAKVLAQRNVALMAMAEKIIETHDVIDDFASIAELLGLTDLECLDAVQLFNATQPNVASNQHTREVLAYVPFRNPLTEAWELKQLLRVHDAAATVAEDALCDLLEELLQTRPIQVLVPLVRSRASEDGIRDRIAAAREERGESGDPRRLPEQIF